MSSEELISKENVSRENLISLFKDAYLNVETSPEGHGDYIQDRYKTWFDLDKKNEFIRFSLMFKPNPEASENDIIRGVNEVNIKYMLCRAFYDGATIQIDYYLWIDGGVSKKNIIFTHKFIQIAIAGMVNKLVELNVIL